jgi:hypothetical protein
VSAISSDIMYTCYTDTELILILILIVILTVMARRELGR